MNQTLDND